MNIRAMSPKITLIDPLPYFPSLLMMNAMNTTGMAGIGSGLFWLHLHWIFVGFAIVGFVLLTVWALRTLKGNHLRSLMLWLLTVGIIGTLVTAPLAAGGFRWMAGARHGGTGLDGTGGMKGMMMDSQMMMRMMDMMMNHDHDENDEAMDEGASGHVMEDEQEEMVNGMMGQ